jgi:hypothetical protein
VGCGFLHVAQRDPGIEGGGDERVPERVRADLLGNGMITPFRKPEGRELLDWQKEFNTEVNKIRWMIEQVISHFKNWTIMHTDYRRPLNTFTTTISAVIGLHFYRMAWITFSVSGSFAGVAPVSSLKSSGIVPP